FFSSRRRHTRSYGDWSSDVCSSDLLQLFTAEGPDLVRAIRETGANVFLDLKLYDIPNTVARTVESVAGLDAQMLSLHLSGGGERSEERRVGKECGGRWWG